MDKATLSQIFSKAFNHDSWLDILQKVFSAKQLFSQPKPILLNNNNKALAAFELGNFTTSDDRIIGLYKIDIRPEVWLERNKVGLRKLLRNVYQYDVDGAIIVFVQEDKWRLSFVSDIKVLNDEGEIIKQVTEPKRYTYLLGNDEKVFTPSERLSKLSGKILSLQDILHAFSVEPLNEEFYKIIQEYFYQLIGGNVGRGKKINEYGDGILQLPNIDDRQIYQEFAVRLIGRTVFCWFLKKKVSSEKDGALMPENLLSSKSVILNPEYYHTILERLFFQTLNTPMNRRVANLPLGAEKIPFLNGGLFEPGPEDFYKANKADGLSDNIKSLLIDDNWFVSFFEELEKYNFTIDENSVVDVEISVDPEMLGRIFENLLAEIDPETGQTARKATGSFYTPREIVDYMATESLVQYLFNRTQIEQEKLRPIFKMTEKNLTDFSEDEVEIILDCLDKVKILDPACGSGAFPIGVLQKIVQALQKLDPSAKWWKKRQVDRITNVLVKKQLKEKLDVSSFEYTRKIGIIQNSLYGVDIQPIAAEISKLRCFLTLIVDENIDDKKENRGIEPLPNLEFKFVTADTLKDLPKEDGVLQLIKRGEKTLVELEQELHNLRQEYLQSYGEDKLVLKSQFKDIQSKLFNQQNLFGEIETSRSHKISTWNPFSHEKSNWFDSKWMFGEEKFDIVIGNPPYGIKYTKQEIENFRKQFKVVVGHSEAYYLFIEKALSNLDSTGVLCYIIPNSWMSNKYAKGLRKLLLEDKSINTLINLNKQSIFNNAVVENSILIAENNKNSINTTIVGQDITHNKQYAFNNTEWTNNENFLINFSEDPNVELLLAKIKNKGTKLSQMLDISNGYKPYQVGYGKNNEGLPLNAADVSNKIYHSLEQKDSSYKPQLKGKNIGKYSISHSKEYIKWGSWLMSPKQSRYFEEPKILVRQIISDTLIAAYDENKYYADQTLYVLINYPNNQHSLKFYTALINSKLIGFYFRKKYSEEDNVFPKIKVNELKDLPVVLPPFTYLVFEILVDYIVKINTLHKDDLIIESVSNSHVVQLFEEVLNAMIIQLYFEENFKNEGIEFIEAAQLNFKSLVDKSDSEQNEIIRISYQKLRERDNKIRQNLKLMDTRLREIVMPIKTGK